MFWIFRENIGEVYPSYDNKQKEREVCKPSRELGNHNGWDRRMQCVKGADIWGIEKVWAGLSESCRSHGSFKTLRSDFLRHISYCIFVLELKNFIRRWFEEHNTPEFGRKVMKGTMQRMKAVADANGMPICGYYKVR